MLYEVITGGQSPAVFDTFQKHFEIAFTNVVKRYVKVVVNPLSPAVPSASQFPSIQVTEMRAEIVRSAEEVTEKQVSTVQRYNLDLRARLLKVPALFYEFFYFVITSYSIHYTKLYEVQLELPGSGFVTK